MTTPAPALTALLDELDRLRAAALSIRSDYPSLPMLEQHDTEVAACWSDGADMAWVDCEEPADAALIVAAVNVVPKLTAAVRAALALADEVEAVGTPVTGRVISRQFVGVRDLREVLTAALEEQP